MVYAGKVMASGSNSVPRMKNNKRIYPDRHQELSELATLIKEKVPPSSSTSRRDRALFAALAVFGCRISELLEVRRKDLVKYYHKESKTLHHLSLFIHTKKNKRQPERKVVATYMLYKPLLDLFLKYIDADFDKDEKLFPIGRMLAWASLKYYFGKHYTLHWFRSYSASYAVAELSLPPHLLQKRFGWARLSSSEPYVHLNQSDILAYEKNKVKEIKEKGLVSEKDL